MSACMTFISLAARLGREGCAYLSPSLLDRIAWLSWPDTDSVEQKHDRAVSRSFIKFRPRLEKP